MKYLIKITKYSFYISLIVFVIERSFTRNGFQASAKNLLLIYSVNFLYAFVISIVNITYFNLLDKKIDWKDKPKKRLIIGVIGSIILSMLAIAVLRLFVVMAIQQDSFTVFLNTSKSYYIFSFILVVNIIIAIHAIYFFKELTSKKVKEHQVISKTETAKFESLKNQLDPHFLFNSLNVLTALIEENPKQAVKFTTKLSKIYRYVLQQKSQDLIEVKDELQFAKTYMDLLKIRFEDAITFSIPDSLDKDALKIIPLSLQLLLENAVKHNVISTHKKLEIKIYQENNYLVIQNNYNPKSNLEKSTKVGLRNIIDRYALVTSSKVIIEQNQHHFIVKLPLLIKKTKIMNPINQQEKYNRAKNQVKDIKGFYGSLISFALVTPTLFAVWYYFTPGIIQWFWFPFIGWGIGLVFHGLKAFGTTGNWETRKIQELMDKDKFTDNIQF